MTGLSEWRESVPCGVKDGQEIWRQCFRDAVGLPLEDDTFVMGCQGGHEEVVKSLLTCRATRLDVQNTSGAIFCANFWASMALMYVCTFPQRDCSLRDLSINISICIEMKQTL